LSFENKKCFHLPCPFNNKYYEMIEAFKGEKTIIIPLHNRDVNAKGDKICNLQAQKK
jgi:hypothetical protein